MTLKQVLDKAQENKVAIGHFNISDLAAFKAIAEAAKELNVPVMIGVSEGEREFLGVKNAVAFVRAAREEYNIPIFLNADHTHSLEKALEAASAGFDEIIFDLSKLPLEENIKQTKEAVLAIRAINPEIVVEGEIGYIGSSSQILDKIPEGVSPLTTVEEAVRFVQETGVDVLAPAVGTMHGLLKSMVAGVEFKRLDIERIKQLAEAVKIPLTLHGGSGTKDEDFIAGVAAGLTIIHVNTELRIAWRRGVEEGLKNPNEVTPYKILLPAVQSIKDVVSKRLKLFCHHRT